MTHLLRLVSNPVANLDIHLIAHPCVFSWAGPRYAYVVGRWSIDADSLKKKALPRLDISDGHIFHTCGGLGGGLHLVRARTSGDGFDCSFCCEVTRTRRSTTLLVGSPSTVAVYVVCDGCAGIRRGCCCQAPPSSLQGGSLRFSP